MIEELDVVERFVRVMQDLGHTPKEHEFYCYKCDTVNTCEDRSHIDYWADLTVLDEFLSTVSDIVYMENKNDESD